MRTIVELRQARADKLASLEKLVNDAGDSDLTEDQAKSFDDIKTEIAGLDKQIQRAADMEALKASSAQVSKHQVPGSPAAVPASPAPARDPGVGFARIVRALAATKGISELAANYADRTWGPEGQDIAKALSANTAVSGGFLVPEQYSSEIIGLLRNRTVIRQAGAVTVPMPGGNLLMNKLAGGASASWIGENQNIPNTTTNFGQIRMSSRTLAALVPISNQLLRYSSPQADGLVRDDLVASMSIQEDAAYLREQGIGAAPKGIRYWANAAHVMASAGTSAANIETDLRNCINALEKANCRMIRPVWILSPRTKNFLWTLRTTDGELVFPEVRSGNLWGYPYYVTNQVPTNLGGGGNETELYFVDMNDCLIGEDQGIVVDVSDTAAYHDGSAVQAAFSLDQTVIRALLRTDFAMRYDQSAAIITGITWGA